MSDRWQQRYETRRNAREEKRQTDKVIKEGWTETAFSIWTLLYDTMWFPWGQGWMRKREQQTDRERERRFSMLALTSHWVSSSASGGAGLLCSSPEKKNKSLLLPCTLHVLSLQKKNWSHMAITNTLHMQLWYAATSHRCYNQFQTGLHACSHLFPFTLVCPCSSSYVLVFMIIKDKIKSYK